VSHNTNSFLLVYFGLVLPPRRWRQPLTIHCEPYFFVNTYIIYSICLYDDPYSHQKCREWEVVVTLLPSPSQHFGWTFVGGNPLHNVRGGWKV
jgi:hypothetical protein